MKKTIKIFSAIVLSTFAMSCFKKEEKTDKVSFNKGEITIVTDDSFKSVVEALAEAYTINYPETKVNVEIQKEDIAFLDLLKQKNRLIAISKPLTKEQIAEYEKQIDLKYHIDYFAADAVLFVVGKTPIGRVFLWRRLRKNYYPKRRISSLMEQILATLIL